MNQIYPVSTPENLVGTDKYMKSPKKNNRHESPAAIHSDLKCAPKVKTFQPVVNQHLVEYEAF